MFTRPRRVAVTLIGVGALASCAPAVASADVTDVVDVATTAGGPQLVIRIDGGDAVLVRERGSDELEIKETGNWTIAIAAGATSRCQPEAGSDSGVFCSRKGLLAPTATRKPIRLEMGPSGGRASASDSPLPIEVQGGAANDSVTGSSFDDLIRLAGGNDDTNGYPGDDLIDMGPGIDQARGGSGADRIDGGDGPDWIEGSAGADTLIGGEGDDLLMGESNPGWYGSETDLNDDRGTNDISDDGGFVDAPADCGTGDDTVTQISAALDPVLSSCEHTLAMPTGAPLTIQGTPAVGSVLSAVRRPVGVEPSYRAVLWFSCDSLSAQGPGYSDCKPRSECPTFRVEARDTGKMFMVVERSTYSLAGGRYKVQPGNEYAWSGRKVGASSAPYGSADIERQLTDDYAWLYVAGVGQQDRSGGEIGTPIAGTNCGSVTPTPTPVSTATPKATPAPAPNLTPSPAPKSEPSPAPKPTPAPGTTPTLVPTPSATSASAPNATPSPAPTPTPAAVPAPTPLSATTNPPVKPAGSSQALAARLVRAFEGTSVRTLSRRRSLVVPVAAAPVTLVRVQIRSGSRWVTVGVGRITADRVTVKFGPVGLKRLKASSVKTSAVKLRVLVRAPGTAANTAQGILRR